MATQFTQEELDVMAFIGQYPDTRIFEIMGEFDLSYDEVAAILDSLKQKKEERDNASK